MAAEFMATLVGTDDARQKRRTRNFEKEERLAKKDRSLVAWS